MLETLAAYTTQCMRNPLCICTVYIHMRCIYNSPVLSNAQYCSLMHRVMGLTHALAMRGGALIDFYMSTSPLS